MNKVELHGTVDRLEVKKINEKFLTTFTVVVKSVRDNREFSNYIPVECWKSLEISNGDFVRVEGSFSTKSWENQSGVKIYKSFVMGFNIFKMTKTEYQNSSPEEDGTNLDTLDPVFAKKSSPNYKESRAKEMSESYIDYNSNPEDIF